MADYLIKDSTLIGIADAIRSKTGTTEPIAVADMAAQIESITGGGVVLPKFEFSDGYFDVGTDNSARTISHGMRKMPDLIIVYAQCLTGNGMANLEIPSTTSFLMAWGVKSTFQCDTRSGYLFNTWGHDNALGLDNLTADVIGDGYVYCQDNSTFVVDGGGHLIPNARYLWFAFSGISAAGVQTAGDHTVTFMSDDGQTVLGTKSVMNGDTCGDPISAGLIDTPTKESTAQYQYAFNGWSLTAGGEADSNTLVNVTEDRTVYAAFESETRAYTINFYDGESIVQTLICEYGTIPSYTPDQKDGYMFIGWDKEIVQVTGNADYYAQWEEVSIVIAEGSCGDNVTYSLTENGLLTISGEGAMNDYYMTDFVFGTDTTVEPPWASYSTSIKTVHVEQGVTHIGDYAFCHSTPHDVYYPSISNVLIADGVTSIGRSAFHYCSALTSISIPDSVTSIGSSVFSATGLTTIKIPKCLYMDAGSNNSLNTTLVSDCTSLESVTFEEGATCIPSYTFRGCTALKTITIPESVIEIGAQAFGDAGLKSAVFENTSGWYVTGTYDERNGTTDISISSNSSQNATYLTSTYRGMYFKRRQT